MSETVYPLGTALAQQKAFLNIIRAQGKVPLDQLQVELEEAFNGDPEEVNTRLGNKNSDLIKRFCQEE